MKLNSQSMEMIKILQENLKTYVPPLMDLTTRSIKKQIKKIISLIQSSLANKKKQHAGVIWSWDDTKTTKNMLVHPKQRFTHAYNMVLLYQLLASQIHVMEAISIILKN